MDGTCDWHVCAQGACMFVWHRDVRHACRGHIMVLRGAACIMPLWLCEGLLGAAKEVFVQTLPKPDLTCS